MSADNEPKVASDISIDSLLIVQNSSTARTRGRSAGSTAAAARARREQQLEDSTRREPSQFERVEAHLQQQTKQELKQTSARDRDRNRERERDRDRELDRGGSGGEEGEGGEASAEPLSEHQQEASNDEGFYEVFQI